MKTDRSARTILSIDFGTSSIKGGLVDERGDLRGWSRIPIDYLAIGGDTLELAWYRPIRDLLARLKPLSKINGISVSGNGPTLLPTDQDGTPLGSSLLWSDGKESRIANQPSFYLPKVRWLRDNDFQVYEKAKYFLTCQAALNTILTGNAVSVIPSPSFAKFFWTNESISAYQMDTALFPPLVATGTNIGEVTQSAAERFGLPKGIPVFAGGLDFFMSILGTGVVRPGLTCDRTGTSEGINYCSGYEINSSKLLTLPHVVPGLINVAGILPASGRIFEWYRRLTGSYDYDAILDAIAKTKIGNDGPFFIPSSSPVSTWDFVSGGLFGLTASHGYGHIGRAVVESIAFSVREVLETMYRNGCVIDELRISGGQARSSVWNQIKADVTGTTIAVPSIVDAELSGNAAAGLTGLGVFGSLVEASDNIVSIAERYNPCRSRYGYYTDSYERYKANRNRIVGLAALPEQPEKI